jgi:thiol-disulfide isomerase/thioredoxin
MRTAIYLSILVVLSSSAMEGQPGYSISGFLEGVDSSSIYLTKKELIKQSISHVALSYDSSKVVNGYYSMEGTVSEIDEYCLFLKDRPGWRTLIFGNYDYTVSGHGDSIWKTDVKSDFVETTIRADFGGPLGQIIDVLNAASDSATFHKERNDLTGTAHYRQINRAMSDSMYRHIVSFIKLNPNSYTSLFAFNRLLSVTCKLPLAEKKNLFQLFPDSLQNHSKGKEYHYRLYQLDSETSIGAKAIHFKLKNPEGKMVGYSNYSDKYILLDFWASWCKPCRAKNELLKPVYRKHGDLLEIIGISLDTNRDDWIRAIEDDEIPWINVSDRLGTNSSVVKLYGIHFIPANYLLNSDGIIVGKNISPRDLDQYLVDASRQ